MYSVLFPLFTPFPQKIRTQLLQLISVHAFFLRIAYAFMSTIKKSKSYFQSRTEHSRVLVPSAFISAPPYVTRLTFDFMSSFSGNSNLSKICLGIKFAWAPVSNLNTALYSFNVKVSVQSLLSGSTESNIKFQ